MTYFKLGNLTRTVDLSIVDMELENIEDEIVASVKENSEFYLHGSGDEYKQFKVEMFDEIQSTLNRVRESLLTFSEDRE